MKLILKFKNAGEELALFKNENEYIYGKLSNNDLTTNVTDEEKMLILRVFYQILPSSKIIRLSDFNIENQKLIHFFEKDKGIHIFYDQTYDNLKLVDESIQSLLNILFNNQNEYVALEKEKNNIQNNFFKRLVKIGQKTIVVFLSTALTFNLTTPLVQAINIDNTINVPQAYEFISKENQKLGHIYFDDDAQPLQDNSYFIKDIQTKGLTVEDIIKTIKSNPNISKEEKALFLSNPLLFQDMLPYYSKDAVLSQQQNLYIIYTNEQDNNIAGAFSVNLRKDGTSFHQGNISINGASDYKTAQKSTLTHEFLHSLTDYSYYYYGSGILELINVKLNNEYFGTVGDSINNNYDTGYLNTADIGNALCEVIDEEVLRQFHATANPKIIINYLMNVIPDEKLAYEFVTNIDFLVKSTLTNMDEEHKQLWNTMKNKVKNGLKAYYEAKYNEKAEDNLTMLYYLDNEEFLNKMDTFFGGALSQKNIEFSHKKSSKFYFNHSINQDLVVTFNTNIVTETDTYTLEDLLSIFGSEEEIPYEKNDQGLYERVRIISRDEIDINLNNMALDNEKTIKK